MTLSPPIQLSIYSGLPLAGGHTERLQRCLQLLLHGCLLFLQLWRRGVSEISPSRLCTSKG